MIEPHKHCPVCSKPIPLDEKTCSEKCEKILIKKQEKIRKTRLAYYVILAIFILTWLSLML